MSLRLIKSPKFPGDESDFRFRRLRLHHLDPDLGRDDLRQEQVVSQLHPEPALAFKLFSLTVQYFCATGGAARIFCLPPHPAACLKHRDCSNRTEH